eukprot:TRINITY_DN7029_c0_g1_i4.p1 TRINITY_DN7029_c0_g1~~TRINITY_DN7029_c0_g1_i4.p1  ORF type:complete len:438 (+),score=54.27 TRINITY_DN7029_c0_g1_i4:59-1372(+)
MGRRKIAIQKITDERLRNITFNKRKNGLIKKAAEIAMLCDLKLVLMFNDLNGNVIKFTSQSPSKVLAHFANTKKNVIYEFTCQDYPNFFKVHHYKPRRTKRGEIKTSVTAMESAHTIKPKAEEEGMRLRSSVRRQNMEDRTYNTLRNLSGSLQAKAMAASNQKEGILNSNIAERHSHTKVKKKDLKIRIPTQNKTLENQMNFLKYFNECKSVVSVDFSDEQNGEDIMLDDPLKSSVLPKISEMLPDGSDNINNLHFSGLQPYKSMNNSVFSPNNMLNLSGVMGFSSGENLGDSVGKRLPSLSKNPSLILNSFAYPRFSANNSSGGGTPSKLFSMMNAETPVPTSAGGTNRRRVIQVQSPQFQEQKAHVFKILRNCPRRVDVAQMLASTNTQNRGDFYDFINLIGSRDSASHLRKRNRSTAFTFSEAVMAEDLSLIHI